jgi:hypothetical protein
MPRVTVRAAQLAATALRRPNRISAVFQPASWLSFFFSPTGISPGQSVAVKRSSYPGDMRQRRHMQDSRAPPEPVAAFRIL